MDGAVAVVSVSDCPRPHRSRHLMCPGPSLLEQWTESSADVGEQAMTVEKDMENEKTRGVCEALSYQKLSHCGQGR